MRNSICLQRSRPIIRGIGVVAVLTLGLSLNATAQNRMWTDQTTGRTVEARFVTVQFDQVWLLRSGGQTFGIPLEHLSAADRQHAEQLMQAKRAQPVARTENPPGRVPYGPGQELGRLANQAIDESSGLAPSYKHPGCFWTHNDSGGAPEIFLFDASGKDLGTYRLQDIDAFDWEDMVSFQADGRSYLVLCDVGNNGRAAGVQMLHVVEEPAPDAAGGEGPRVVPVLRTIHYSYEDDHRDCEAVGFDPSSRSLLFVTKERAPESRVYELAWPADDARTGRVATQVGTVQLRGVTGMDISPDGRRAVVLTYGNAFEYQRQDGQSWSEAFAQTPREICIPERIQGESICYGADGRALYLTSERVPTPLWMIPALGACGTAALTVDCDFPGGNIIVERIEGQDVYLRQDLRDTSTWWFYWCFRVRSAESQRLNFHFTDRNVFAARGPAFSTDGGTTWRWLGTSDVRGDTFSYTFTAEQPEVRFCFAMPYLQQHLQQFLGKYRDHANLSVGQLCTTRKGRPVERLDVGQLAGEPAWRVVLTARHHACESMASYVLEGFLRAVLDDTEDGRWYRDQVRILAVPFVDKDGVQDGDQGKNRRPHDHNRDYGGTAVYPTVAAIRQLVPEWSEGQPLVVLDLHCPHIRGAYNEVIYMVGRPEPELWAQQTALGHILEQVQQGPLVYRASDNLPFGQAWNTRGNVGDKMSCSMWAAQLPGIRLATGMEIPYAKAGQGTVDADTARAFGRDLAAALRRYLSQPLAATR
jgi:hypothetical protein